MRGLDVLAPGAVLNYKSSGKMEVKRLQLQKNP